MGHFGSTGLDLGHFGPSGSVLAHFGSFWVLRARFGPFWALRARFGHILNGFLVIFKGGFSQIVTESTKSTSTSTSTSRCVVGARSLQTSPLVEYPEVFFDNSPPHPWGGWGCTHYTPTCTCTCTCTLYFPPPQINPRKNSIFICFNSF